MAVTRRSRAAASRKTPTPESSDPATTAETPEGIDSKASAPEAIAVPEVDPVPSPEPEAAPPELTRSDAELSEAAPGLQGSDGTPTIGSATEPDMATFPVSQPEPVIEASQGEEAMSQTEEVVAINPQPVQADAAIVSSEQPVAMVGGRPVMPSEVQIVGTIMSAGERPIATSSMEVFGTFFNGRPIASSSLRLADMLPGDRPIFYSDVQMLAGDAGLPGNRPIMVSPAGMLSAALLPGNRPIFSNQIDPEPAALMGYLD
ncbi:MAG: hypothetical protein VKJ24_12435 [Synechococcales bacterium]|nr:hypothetical protein [Synechococcales bacterium]